MRLPRPVPSPAAPAEARRLLARARRISRDLGPAGVAVRLVQRLVPRRILFLEWYDVFEAWAARPGPSIEAGDTEARWADESDAAAAGALFRGEAEIRRRLALGDRGALLLDGGEVVGHLFFTQRPYDENRLVYRTGGDSWWMYDGYVDPRRRGRRLYGRLFGASLNALSQGGRPVRAFSTVDRLNTASQRAAARRGSRIIGRVLTVRAAGVTVSRVRWVGGRPSWRVHRGPRTVTLPGTSRATPGG